MLHFVTRKPAFNSVVVREFQTLKPRIGAKKRGQLVLAVSGGKVFGGAYEKFQRERTEAFEPAQSRVRKRSAILHITAFKADSDVFETG
jgi:6-phosphogluconolactonase/glucosamine-6-phosphate isomerase/deaminase